MSEVHEVGCRNCGYREFREAQRKGINLKQYFGQFQYLFCALLSHPLVSCATKKEEEKERW
jgi:hypothetical protein